MTQRLISPNLPTVLTSFIGRQREVVEISQLPASAHLMSLIGARLHAQLGVQVGERLVE